MLRLNSGSSLFGEKRESIWVPVGSVTCNRFARLAIGSSGGGIYGAWYLVRVIEDGERCLRCIVWGCYCRGRRGGRACWRGRCTVVGALSAEGLFLWLYKCREVSAHASKRDRWFNRSVPETRGGKVNSNPVLPKHQTNVHVPEAGDWGSHLSLRH
jgi:hypothetical protein